MRAWGVLTRRAARVAIRSPWRTIWTGLLVVIPVAACAVLLSAVWGHHVTTSSVERGFGRADAVYWSTGRSVQESHDLAAAVAVALPDGSRVASVETASGLVVVPDHVIDDDGGEGREARSDPVRFSGAVGGSRGGVSAQMADWDDPILSGMLSLVGGRAPRAGEVVVSPELSRSLGVDVGDRIHLVDAGAELRVVGIGTAGSSADGLVLAAGELVPAPNSSPMVATAVFVGVPAGTDLPDGAAVESSAGNGQGGGEINGPQIADPLLARRVAERDGVGLEQLVATSTTSPVGVLGGLVAASAMVVGVLAGAAFGLGSRRRLRATGLLAANGADRGQLAVAAASEAVVVAVPAVILGVAVGLVVPAVWIGLRLPGGVSLVESDVPWPWVVMVMLAAVVASAAGSVGFSNGVRDLPPSALLDARAVSRTRGAQPRIGVLSVLGGLLLAYVVGSILIYPIAARIWLFGGVASLAVLVLWAACAFAGLWLLRLVLDRDPIGRLVDRDLRRHRMASTAAVAIVATWVFVAVGGTATGRFESVVTNDEVTTTYFAGDSTSTVAEPVPVTYPTTVPAYQPGQGVVPTTAVAPAGPDGSLSAVPARVGMVLTASDPSGVASSASGWVQRGSENRDTVEPDTTVEPDKTVEPDEGVDSDNESGSRSSVPSGLAEELAAEGLETSPAMVGNYTGPCSVCPSGFVPSVLVLEHAEGVGLAPATVDLLNAGMAVTPYDIAGVESELVAGVPVRYGAAPSGYSAVVLGSSITDGSQLADPRPALVADTSTLSSEQVLAVSDLIRDDDLAVVSWDPRIDPMSWETTDGWSVPTGTSGWATWSWLVLLVAVTLAATAAHRREQDEAGRLLWMLGAGPRASRRLSSLTAFSLAGVGVALGVTAVVVVVGFEALHQTGPDPFSGLWNMEASWLLVASLAVPVVVGALARFVPAASAGRGPNTPDPI